MRFKPYSVSKIECFLDCPKKFEWRYIIKPDVKQTVKHFEKGKLWHSLIEHSIKRTTKNFVKPKFYELSQEEYLHELSNIVKFVKGKFFLPYLQDVMRFKQLLEQRFSITDNGEVSFNNDQTPLFKGFIDLVQFDDFDVEIIDWKTGGKSIENIQRYPKSTFQLDVYAYVAHKMFNPKSIIGKYVYVEHEYEHVLKNFNHMETWREILWNINTIENCKDFERKESMLCDWCEFRGICLE